MFEIKNTPRNVSGINNGKDMTKFFNDLNNPSTNCDICGGVLVSLNSPVDINVPPLVPRFIKLRRNILYYLSIGSRLLRGATLEMIIIVINGCI